MAILRCRMHAPHSSHPEFMAAVEPVGFPRSALVCGSRGCEEPAFIWLEGPEKMDYDSGVRVFGTGENDTKVRAA